jgi:hypothetical protein
VFIASDEAGVQTAAVARFAPLDARCLGDLPLHKDDPPVACAGNADQALLDCVLLSRRRYVLKCWSALSGCAKVLNSDLECCRVAACKMFSDMPYFPACGYPQIMSSSPIFKALKFTGHDGSPAPAATCSRQQRPANRQ